MVTVASETMVRFLCRHEVRNSHVDADVLYYARRENHPTGNPGDTTVLGVARTPVREVPDSAHTEAAFRENVERVAEAVRWFDDPL